MSDWHVLLVDLKVEAVSGLRVGAPRGDGDATDAPLLRDGRGRPLVPGSSLKGVLRSAAERLLRGAVGDAAESGTSAAWTACDILDRPCGGPPGRDKQVDPTMLCRVCRVFGSPHLGGRIAVDDLVCTADEPATVVRDGVAIDRDELKAAGRLKYDYEVLVPGTALTGRLRLDDPEPGEVGLLLGLLDLVDLGVVTVGGGASKGLGRLRLCSPPELRRLQASQWILGQRRADAVDADTARRELAEQLEGVRA